MDEIVNVFSRGATATDEILGQMQTVDDGLRDTFTAAKTQGQDKVTEVRRGWAEFMHHDRYMNNPIAARDVGQIEGRWNFVTREIEGAREKANVAFREIRDKFLVRSAPLETPPIG
jgi:hypothetical protein